MQLNVLHEQAHRSAPQRRGHQHQVDAASLQRALRQHVDGEVRFDDGSRSIYATDASNFRRVPIGVVVPRTIDAVVATVAICREHGAPITGRGAGTSLNGQTCNTAIIIDYSKYLNRIVEFDPASRSARVQPGVICDAVSNLAEHGWGLTYAAAPATHEYATFGGMLGNNSCGVHSLITPRVNRLGKQSIPGGRTSDNTIELEVLTSDGQRLCVGETSDDQFARLAQSETRRGHIYRGLRALRDQYGELIRQRYPAIPRRVSGYNLDDLLPENDGSIARALVGSEGTCVNILEATMRLVDWPSARTLLVLGYRDVFEAADHVPELLCSEPIGLEGMDDRLVGSIRRKGLHPGVIDKLPDGNGWLLVEFGGKDERDAAQKLQRCLRGLARGGMRHVEHYVYEDQREADEIWDVRESGLAATAFVEGQRDAWPGWEDSAVHPERLGEYLRELRSLYDEYGFKAAMYGHFGQACVHSRIDFGLSNAREVERYRAFLDDASDLVVRYGGSFSAEHGDGQAKSTFLPKMFGDELMEAMRRFKRLWDPDGIMNPGKIVDPDDPADDLRLGQNYQPRPLKTHYQWPDDEGDFSRAALRCVGVGKCRRTKEAENAFMCPSFLATREEKHTTRGRARALFDMVGGDLPGGWKSDAVKETLDLCLGCKACKTDCPVNVDMAQYKSEFLSHYYEGRAQPRAAYAMGLIGYWAKLASHAPGLANLMASAPGVSSLGKAAAGMSQHRRVPRFTKEPFTSWFKRERKERATSKRTRPGAGDVLLYPDVFNNHFYPDSLVAAAQVLERLGYAVDIPEHPPPALRPMIHYGMLPAAKRMLAREVRRLMPAVEAGASIVCLEPSTVAVFRDELRSLFPNDDRAMAVRDRVLLLSEFLDRENVALPLLARDAILHMHCHQRAVLDAEATRRLLRRMQVDFTEPEASCCGMAGSFGLEADHYDVSMQIAEMNLLPAVRSAPKETLVVSEGFSCRQQISEGSDRDAIHLSQVLRMAMEPREPHAYPERRAIRDRRASVVPAAIALAGAAVLVSAAASRLFSRDDASGASSLSLERVTP